MQHYIYVEYYIHIIWTIPKNITKMKIFLKIPYSIYVKRIIYTIKSPKYIKKTNLQKSDFYIYNVI